MHESILDPPLNTIPIPETDHANPAQTYLVTPHLGVNTDWSVPPHAGGLVATSKDGDSSMVSC
jgi:hypothetical protein